MPVLVSEWLKEWICAWRPLVSWLHSAVQDWWVLHSEVKASLGDLSHCMDPHRSPGGSKGTSFPPPVSPTKILSILTLFQWQWSPASSRDLEGKKTHPG
jgi:hypothetical protein